MHDVPACVTVNGWPPIVRLAVREVVLVFTAALKATAPSPDPVADVVRVIHGAPLNAVHAHPVDERTAMVPVPPALGTAWLAGDTAYVHDAAACVTVIGLPATVRVATLELVVVFAVALKVTWPAPVPLVPDPIGSHDALLLADQAQPAGAVTEIDPAPPAAAKD